MAEVEPIKTPGALVEFAGDDVALLGGIRRLSGELTFQDTVANGGAQVTLSQLLSGVGAAAWTDLTDTPAAIQADQAVFGDTGGVNLALRNMTLQQIQAHEPGVTGIITPTQLQLSVFSATQIQVSAGDLAIVVRTTPENVTKFPSNLGTPATITPVNLALRTSFWTASDAGLTGIVVIKEYATEPTPADIRQEAFLGISLHEGSQVVAVINTPDMWADQGHGVNDLWRQAVAGHQGLPRTPGTGVGSEIAATLTIATTDMTLLGKGVGFHQSAGVNPNISPTIPGQSPLVFDTIQSDGSVFANDITVFPKTWNNVGTETALTGQRAAVHQVAWLIDGSAVVQLGTTNYQNFDTAVDNIGRELASNLMWDIARDFGAEIGVAVISAAAGNAWADGQHRFIPLVNGGITAGGVTNFLGLTDTPTNYTGKEGQVLRVSAGEVSTAFGKIRTQFLLQFPNNVAPAVSIALPIPVNAFRFRIDNIRMMVDTAEDTTPVVFDVNLDGTTIFPGGKPTLAVSATDTNFLADATANNGQRLSLDIDSGGTAWAGLTVAIQ